AHQIELGKRWIGDEVVADEHAALADVAADPVATFLAAKEPGEPLLADLRGDRLRVVTLPRAVDRTLAQVTAEQLERPAPLSAQLDQQHRQRVHLLAGRATGDPDPHRRRGSLGAKQLGEDLLGESVEHRAIAKELGDMDQEIFVDRARLLGGCRQIRAVLVERAKAVLGEPTRKSALDRGALVTREVDPARFAQLLEDPVDGGRLGRRLRRDARPAPEPRDLAELLADLWRRENDLGDAGGDRAPRHLGELRGRRVLREREPTRGPDRAQAL